MLPLVTVAMGLMRQRLAAQDHRLVQRLIAQRLIAQRLLVQRPTDESPLLESVEAQLRSQSLPVRR
jgi:hypothetical protein